LVLTKYGYLPRFHWFSPNFSSQYLCSQESYQRLVKSKSNHHHCPVQYQFFYSWTPNRGRHEDPPLGSQTVPMGKGCLMGGRHASVLITSRWRGPQANMLHICSKP
jgi:hypothetical protein